MWDPVVGSSSARGRVLNAMTLQNAVLCAECDVVSDSPNAQRMVCGSRSLFNIARMLGGNLPRERAALIRSLQADSEKTEVVLTLSRAHRPRRKASA